MNTTTTTRALIGVLAFALIGPLPAAFAVQQSKEDEVLLKAGSKQTGKVVAENFDLLQLEIKKGGKQGIEWSKIASVKYCCLPLEFTEAMDARTSDPEGAVPLLQALVTLEGLGDPGRQTAMCELAALQQRLGATDDAIKSWQALLAAYPEGRYLGVAARGLVDAYLGKEQPAEAGKALDALGGNPAASKFAALQPELKGLRARILMAQGKFADARAAFEQVEKDATASPDASAMAKLGVAESLKAEGKTSEAETRFKALVEGEGPNFLLAGAWNGIGDLRSKAGADGRNADLLWEGLYAYLRGVVQYAPAAGEPQDEYERALAGSATCFRFLAQLETKKEVKAAHETSANQQIDRLRKAFPNSKYLQK